MSHLLDDLLEPLVRDLETSGMGRPRVEPLREPCMSPGVHGAMLVFAGHVQPVHADLADPPAEQLARMTDLVMEYLPEELVAIGRRSNWPLCREHPTNHPLAPGVGDGRAVWACPRSGRAHYDIGSLPTA